MFSNSAVRHFEIRAIAERAHDHVDKSFSRLPDFPLTITTLVEEQPYHIANAWLYIQPPEPSKNRVACLSQEEALPTRARPGKAGEGRERQPRKGRTRADDQGRN